jgi:superfamily II DNA or RNA helicase
MKLLLDNQRICFILTKEEKEEILPIIIRKFSEKDMSNAFAGGTFHNDRIKVVKFVYKTKDVYWLNNGFTKEFLVFIKKNGWKVDEILDKRERFDFQKKEWTDEEIKSYLPNFDYVEHQIRLVRAALKSSVGILRATTGAGKTISFLALIKIIKLKTLVLVNKIGLASQTQKVLINGGLDFGISTGGGYKDGKDGVVATIGSVGKVLDLHNYKCLIIDECHVSSANGFQDFLEKFSPAIKWGFSATPEGNSDFKWIKIRQYLGGILEEVKSKELMDNKVITRPVINMIKNHVERTPDWESAYKLSIVQNYERNKWIQELVEKHNEPTLILIRQIEHGELLQKLLPDAVFVSGIHSITEREQVIKDFEERKIKTVISSNVFNEGISINIIRVLIIASAYKSFTETTQKIGRILRLDEGKEEAIVYDFLDIGNKYTQKHSKERVKHYMNAGFDVFVDGKILKE